MPSPGTVLKTAFNPLAPLADFRRHQEAKRAARYKEREAERLRQVYYDAQEAKQARMGKIDWQPAMLSDIVGPYKKTQAPIALAALNAAMQGQSRDAQPWEGEGQGAVNQAKYDKLYGTPEEQLAAQKKADDDFGYEVGKLKPVDTRAITDPGNDIRPDEDLEHDAWHWRGGKR